MLDYIDEKSVPMTNTLAYCVCFVSYKEKKGCEYAPGLYISTLSERDEEKRVLKD